MGDIGTIASIVGVASAGFRLSLILNAVSCEVSNAGLEIHSISKSVTLFSMMLKQTGNVLQSADSVHSPEAVDTAKSVSERSTKVFDEINEMLDRLRTKQMNDGTYTPTVEQRFRSCFKRHRVTYLLAQLENLKLSLSVMLQVLQLGKLMATASRSDPPEEVAFKLEAIQQERAEAQNGIIIRHWQMSHLEKLSENMRREEELEAQGTIGNGEVHDDEQTLIGSASSQLSIEAAPSEATPSNALVKMGPYSLGELDQTLHQIKESPRDMLQASNHVIDPLLEKWTVWREVRERRHARESSRFVPSVQNLAEEDEEERPYHQRYQEREDSPRGYYLEGHTTDWRKPNSASARHEASQRRKKYSKYQPSVSAVSAASSEVEDSPGSAGSRRRSSRHHAINSDPESSQSEPEGPPPRPRRRSSGSPTNDRKMSYNEGPPLAHTYTAPTQPIPNWITNVPPGPRPPPSVSSGQSIASRLSSPAVHPPGHRPWAAPDQSFNHHAYSSPLPPIHTGNAVNPYAPAGPPAGYPRYLGPQAPIGYGPPPPQSSAQVRYAPPGANRMPMPPRPGSQDGKARSPSRLSYQSNASPPESSRHYRDGERRHQNGKTTKQNLREGATKGLLGAGAIAGFLEALEGLNI